MVPLAHFRILRILMKYTYTFPSVSYQKADDPNDVTTLVAENDEVLFLIEVPGRCLQEAPRKIVLERRRRRSGQSPRSMMTYNGQVLESAGKWLCISCSGLLIIAGLHDDEEKWWLQEGDHIQLHLES